MENKLDYYDILAIVIPGVLITAGTSIALGWADITFRLPSKPESIVFVLFLGIVVFVGHLLQALGSVLQPVCFLTWGGKPSTTLLEGKRCFRGISRDDAARIARALRRDMAGDNSASHAEVSPDSLFSYAMSIVNRHGFWRVDRFNALYAYHRALLTAVLLFCAEAPLRSPDRVP